MDLGTFAQYGAVGLIALVALAVVRWLGVRHIDHLKAQADEERNERRAESQRCAEDRRRLEDKFDVFDAYHKTEVVPLVSKTADVLKVATEEIRTARLERDWVARSATGTSHTLPAVGGGPR